MVKIKKQKVRFKKRDVKDSPKSSSKIKNAFKFLISLLIVSAIGIGFVKVKNMFLDAETFTVKKLDVKVCEEDGTERTVSVNKEINAAVSGKNIFFVDLESLKKMVDEEHPELKNVVIRRRLPNSLVLSGKLRKPIAQVRSDRYYFVDKEGVVLPDVKNFPDPNMPIVTGMGANLAKVYPMRFSKFEKEKLDKALELIIRTNETEELDRYELKFVDATDPGNISFFLEGFNVEIKIGKSNFRNRLKVLATILAQLGEESDTFKYIDLRFEDPIIGPR